VKFQVQYGENTAAARRRFGGKKPPATAGHQALLLDYKLLKPYQSVDKGTTTMAEAGAGRHAALPDLPVLGSSSGGTVRG
jgi:hypothetical protein